MCTIHTAVLPEKIGIANCRIFCNLWHGFLQFFTPPPPPTHLCKFKVSHWYNFWLISEHHKKRSIKHFITSNTFTKELQEQAIYVTIVKESTFMLRHREALVPTVLVVLAWEWYGVVGVGRLFAICRFLSNHLYSAWVYSRM